MCSNSNEGLLLCNQCCCSSHKALGAPFSSNCLRSRRRSDVIPRCLTCSRRKLLHVQSYGLSLQVLFSRCVHAASSEDHRQSKLNSDRRLPQAFSRTGKRGCWEPLASPSYCPPSLLQPCPRCAALHGDAAYAAHMQSACAAHAAHACTPPFRVVSTRTPCRHTTTGANSSACTAAAGSSFEVEALAEPLEL